MNDIYKIQEYDAFLPAAKPAFSDNDVDLEVKRYRGWLNNVVSKNEDLRLGLNKKEARNWWKKEVKHRYSAVDGFYDRFDQAFSLDSSVDNGNLAIEYLDQVSGSNEENPEVARSLRAKKDAKRRQDEYGAFDYSIDATQKLFGSAVKTLADVFESDKMSGYAEAVIRDQEEQIKSSGYLDRKKYKERGLEQAWEEDSVGGVFNYIATTFIESSTQAVGGIAVGAGVVAGGTIGAVAGAGGLLYSALVGIGTATEEAEAKGVYDEDDAIGVLSTGLALAAIDVAAGVVTGGLASVGSRGARVAVAASRDPTVRKASGQLIKTMAKSAGTEAVTSLISEAALIGSTAAQGGKYETSEQWRRLSEAFIIGGAIGTGTGGSLRLLNTAIEASQQRPVPEGINSDRIRTVDPVDPEYNNAQTAPEAESSVANAGSVRPETKIKQTSPSQGQTEVRKTDSVGKTKKGSTSTSPPKVVVIGGTTDSPTISLLKRGRGKGKSNSSKDVFLNEKEGMTEREGSESFAIKVIDKGDSTENRPATVSVSSQSLGNIEIDIDPSSISSDGKGLQNHTVIIDNSGDTPVANVVQLQESGSILNIDQDGLKKQIVIDSDGNLALVDASDVDFDSVQSHHDYVVSHGNIQSSVDEVVIKGEPQKVDDPEAYREHEDLPQTERQGRDDFIDIVSPDTSTPEERARNQRESDDNSGGQGGNGGSADNGAGQNGNPSSELKPKSWLRTFSNLFKTDYGSGRTVSEANVKVEGRVKFLVQEMNQSVDVASEVFKTPSDRARLNDFLQGKPIDRPLEGDQAEAAGQIRRILDEGSRSIVEYLEKDVKIQAERINTPLPDEIFSMDAADAASIIRRDSTLDRTIKSKMLMLLTIKENNGSYLKVSYDAYSNPQAFLKRFGNPETVTEADALIRSNAKSSIKDLLLGRVVEQERKQAANVTKAANTEIKIAERQSSLAEKERKLAELKRNKQAEIDSEKETATKGINAAEDKLKSLKEKGKEAAEKKKQEINSLKEDIEKLKEDIANKEKAAETQRAAKEKSKTKTSGKKYQATLKAIGVKKEKLASKQKELSEAPSKIEALAKKNKDRQKKAQALVKALKQRREKAAESIQKKIDKKDLQMVETRRSANAEIERLRKSRDRSLDIAKRQDVSSNSVSSPQWVTNLTDKTEFKAAMNESNPVRRAEGVDRFVDQILNDLVSDIAKKDNFYERLFDVKTDEPRLSDALLHQRDDVPASFRQFLGEIHDPIQNAMLTSEYQLDAIQNIAMGAILVDSLRGKQLFEQPAEGLVKVEIDNVGAIKSSIDGYYATPEVSMFLKDYYGKRSNTIAGNIIGGINGTWKMVSTVLDPLDVPLNAWGSLEAALGTGVINPLSVPRKISDIISASKKGKEKDISNLYKTVDSEGNVVTSMTNEEVVKMWLDKGVTGDSLTSNIINESSSEIARFFDATFNTGGTFAGRQRLMQEARGDLQKSIVNSLVDKGSSLTEAMKKAHNALDGMAKAAVHSSTYARERRYGYSHEASLEFASKFTLDTMPSASQVVPFISKTIAGRNAVMGPYLTFFSEAYRTAFNRARISYQWAKSGDPKRQLDAVYLMGSSVMAPSVLLPAASAATGVVMLTADSSIDENVPEYSIPKHVTDSLYAQNPVFSKFSNMGVIGRTVDGDYLMVDNSRLSTYGPVSDVLSSITSAMNDPTTSGKDVLSQVIGGLLDPQFVTQTYIDWTAGKLSTPQAFVDYVGKSFTNGTMKFGGRVYDYINEQPDGKGRDVMLAELTSQVAGVPFLRRNAQDMMRSNLYPVKKEISTISKRVRSRLQEPRPLTERDAEKLFSDASAKHDKEWEKMAWFMGHARVIVKDMNEHKGITESTDISMRKLFVKDGSEQKGIISSGDFSLLVRNRKPPFSVGTDTDKAIYARLIGDKSSLSDQAKQIIRNNIQIFERVQKRMSAER